MLSRAVAFCLSMKARNFLKNAMSSWVYLLRPAAMRTTQVGGVGDRSRYLLGLALGRDDVLGFAMTGALVTGRVAERYD